MIFSYHIFYFLSSSLVVRFTHIMYEEMGNTGFEPSNPAPAQIIAGSYQLSYIYETIIYYSICFWFFFQFFQCRQ